MYRSKILILVTKAAEREVYHLFDGSTGQTEATAAWDPLMKSCGGKTNDWRTYAAVVWEDPRHYDRGKWPYKSFSLLILHFGFKNFVASGQASGPVSSKPRVEFMASG